MQVPTIRVVAALLFATASVAYAGGAPTAARVNAGILPLSVDMECPSVAGSVYTCQASASGGSDTGYSFVWSSSNGNAWESYDADGYSEADAACYGGLGQGSTSTVTATVTDSNGRTASKSRIINCVG